jgi:pimeloyl-ACP methyl ester carboxylesterase
VSATTLRRGDAELRVVRHGEGPAVLFQHGLGGDEPQVVASFPDDAGWRRITVECRGHGGSTLGTTRPLDFPLFTGDILAAVAAEPGPPGPIVVGGISMGAAIALRIAALHPARVVGLILVRPAWGFAPATHLAPMHEVAALLETLPPDEARRRFEQSPTAERLAVEAPDNLTSLTGFLTRPDATAFAAVLGDISGGEGPGVTREAAAAIACPTLVIGNRRDAIHPLAIAEELAAAIPGAQLLEVHPKADDPVRCAAEVRAAIRGFLAAVLPVETAA